MMTGHRALGGKRHGGRGGAQGLLVAALAALLLAGLAGCGAGGERWTVDGHLVAGDADIWIVDTTPIAIGGATRTGGNPDLGAAIHATGRRASGGVLSAERITVGPVDAAALKSSLPEETVGGTVEVLDAQAGQWKIAGRTVRVPASTPGARGVVTGQRVTVRGYSLANGDLLATSITAAGVTPTPAPTRAAPTEPPKKPGKPEPPKKPDKDEGDEDGRTKD